jgi:hypothetical protein
MVTTRSSINIVAAFGLALGAVFGMAGTFVAQPNIQAVLWALDGAGLVMAAALLTLKYFKAGHDLVAGGFLVFAGRLARAPSLFVMSSRLSAKSEIESIGKDATGPVQQNAIGLDTGAHSVFIDLLVRFVFPDVGPLLRRRLSGTESRHRGSQDWSLTIEIVARPGNLIGFKALPAARAPGEPRCGGRGRKVAPTRKGSCS